MLTPDYLEHIADNAVNLYTDLENSVIKDIVRRLVSAGEMTESARWQIKRLQQSGLMYEDVIKRIAQTSGESDKVIKRLFEDSAIESLKYDDKIYKQVGLNPISIKQSPAMLKILTTGVNKTNGTLKNLTLTSANSAQSVLIQSLDNTYMQVASGAFDYNTAIFNAVKNITTNGLDITYDTGHKDKIDVVVRRNVLAGINQTACKIQDERANEMNSDLVETSAHAGARPEHAIWQGRVFSRSGTNKKYPDFKKSTGYGTGPGLGGWNCRHNYYPFFEGLSDKSYTDKELDEMNNKKVTYNNKEYTEYEATQMQRKAERNIRTSKRELAAYDGIMSSNAQTSLRREAQNKFNTVTLDLKQKENDLKDFIKQTGFTRDKARERVVDFNNKISSKAIGNNKKILANTKKYDIIKTDDISIDGITKKGKSGLKDAYNTALNHGLTTNTETLLNIDKITGKYVTKKHDGVKSRVTLSDEDIDVLHTAPKNSIISIHNHPGNSSFSDADMRIMTKFESISDLTVIGHENTIYTLSVGDGIRPKLGTITDDYDNIRYIKGIKYSKKVQNNELTHDKAWHEHSNEIVEEMAKKYGWKYRRYELNE